VPAVWQPRFWEHLIRDTDDLDQHRAYCWTDPVRHGLVHDPMDWPFSSFNKRDQRYAEDGTVAFPDMKFPPGEFECAPPSGGRVSRPTKADAA
jgi:putative transposase